MPGKGSHGKDRLLAIDCLRGAAALFVFIFHVAVIANFPKRTLPPFTLLHRTYSNLMSPLSLGASGVNLFFVISGFCLALQQWRTGREHLFDGQQKTLWRYARNRLARIGPAYWLTVLLSALLVLALRPVSPGWFAIDVLLHSTFLHFVHPRTFLSLHGGLWSMATEVEFYVLFPFLLWLFSRVGGWGFIALCALINLGFRVAVALYPFSPNDYMTSWSSLLSYQLPGRLLEFTLGMWLAEIYLRRDTRWAACFRFLWIGLLPVALVCRAAGPAYLPDIALGLFYFALCGAVLLPVASGSAGGESVGPARLWVWAARFGRASYSFFLIHYPVLVILALVCPVPESSPYGRYFFLLATGFPVSLGAGVLLYLGVELPMWERLRG